MGGSRRKADRPAAASCSVTAADLLTASIVGRKFVWRDSMLHGRRLPVVVDGGPGEQAEMARKTSLSLETLVALGAEKLAQIVLDEAMANAPFREKANAALAGAKGADAVAALIDSRPRRGRRHPHRAAIARVGPRLLGSHAKGSRRGRSVYRRQTGNRQRPGRPRSVPDPGGAAARMAPGPFARSGKAAGGGTISTKPCPGRAGSIAVDSPMPRRPTLPRAGSGAPMTSSELIWRREFWKLRATARRRKRCAGGRSKPRSIPPHYKTSSKNWATSRRMTKSREPSLMLRRARKSIWRWLSLSDGRASTAPKNLCWAMLADGMAAITAP